MRGIYLNDIPVDLFLKYFTKDDLQDRALEPSMIDDNNRTFYVYNFTVGGTTYTYYSYLDSVYDEFEIKESILSDFKDLLPNLTPNGIVLTKTNTLTGKIAFFQLSRPSIYPFRYYMENANGSGGLYFISCNGSISDQLNFINNEISDLTIIDTRDNTNPFGSGVKVDIVYDPEIQVKKVFSQDPTPLLLGYFFENRINKIQETNLDGQLLFLDESGNKTIREFRSSSFLRHNAAIRRGFNKLIDPVELMRAKYNPGTIGIYQQGVEKKLVFYEDFKRTTTYTKITSVPSGESFQSERISVSLKNQIGSTSFTKINFEPKYKEVLNMFRIPRIEVEQANPNSQYELRLLNIFDSISVGDRVIIDLYLRKVKYRDLNYLINKINNKDTITIDSSINVLKDLEIISILNIEYVKIPVSTFQGVPAVRFSSNIQAAVQTSGNDRYVVLDSRSYNILTNDSATPKYSLGYIIYPVESYREKQNIQYIGVISTIKVATAQVPYAGEFTLGKYTPSVTPITITDEYFDLGEFEPEIIGGNPTGNYISKKYLRDETDNLYFLEVDEKIEKVTYSAPISPIVTPIYNEFINYDHSIGNNPFLTPYFQAKNGKYLNRSTNQISGPSLLNTFEDRFRVGFHYIVDGYFEQRGEYIPDNVINGQKINVISRMSSDFLNRRNTDFYTVDNILYDQDAPMKMRIYTEAFKTVLSNNFSFLDSLPKRRSNIKFSDLDGRIFLYKKELGTENTINIKEFTSEDFSKQRLETQSEINNLNAFQKLLDYKELPYNQKRAISLLESKKRNKIFSDKDVSEQAIEDVVTFDKTINIQKIQRSSFKRIMISTLSDFFFNSNNYEEDNFFVKSYYDFVKSKLEDLEATYSTKERDTSYKAVLYRTLVSTDINSFISKIVSFADDWRLL